MKLVAVDLLLERQICVRAKELQLLLAAPALARGAQLPDQRQRVDRLADVDRDGGHLQVFAVLLVLALPDELRVERWVAWVARGRGPLLFRAGERLELGGGDDSPGRTPEKVA